MIEENDRAVQDKDLVYINAGLNVAEQDALAVCKKKSGIRSSADLVRFLLNRYARGRYD